jgi:hypothetical protein
VLPSGDLAVGGDFTSAGGVPASRFAIYTFGSNCPPDLNCDGMVTSQDFFDFLAAFFSNDLAADFNHDNTVTSQDFFDFISAFFTGC